MRIAQLAPLIESVPPRGYGGIELVVSLLTDDLVALGHDVTLFASGDSSTDARLVEIIPRALRKDPDVKPYHWPAYDYRSLLALEKSLDRFDLVHNHMGWQALPFLSKLDIPVVTTNHNLIDAATAPVYLEYRSLPYVGISNAYVRSNYCEVLNYVDVVYNGIDVARYHFDESTSRDYLCFLGRLCHDKGIVQAIEIAKRVGLKLRVAGKVDPNDRDYFERYVEPLLSDPQIEYIGEVDHDGKVELFAGALALVYPINFLEPFGLVMAEALACGVPVLALNKGSVSEVLCDRTAVIADSIDELVHRFDEVTGKTGADCRERAFRMFDRAQMTQHYENVYQQVLLAQPTYELERAS